MRVICYSHSGAMPLYLLTMFAERPHSGTGSVVIAPPQGPALVLLNLIDRDPAGVLRALS